MSAYSFTAAEEPQFYATITGVGDDSADILIDVIASDGATMRVAAGASRSASNIPGTVWAMAGSLAVRAREFISTALFGSIPSQNAFFLRLNLWSPIPEIEPTDEGAPRASRFNGLRGRVIGAATAKNDVFAITVNGDAIGVIVCVDLERGAPEWKVMAGSGLFTGSFIMTL